MRATVSLPLRPVVIRLSGGGLTLRLGLPASRTPAGNGPGHRAVLKPPL